LGNPARQGQQEPGKIPNGTFRARRYAMTGSFHISLGRAFLPSIERAGPLTGIADYTISQKKFPKRWRHPCRDDVANPQVCPTFSEISFEKWPSQHNRD
jgi:hypothetical protein